MSSAKPSKEQIARRERRQRDGDMDGFRLKLSIPEEQKRPGMTYRWVNDDGYRVQGFTTGTGDWEVDPDFEPRHVGRTKEGQPMAARAVFKPKDWYAEDRARKQRDLDASMDRIAQKGRRRGDPVPNSEGVDAYAVDTRIEDSLRRKSTE